MGKKSGISFELAVLWLIAKIWVARIFKAISHKCDNIINRKINRYSKWHAVYSLCSGWKVEIIVR